MYRSITILIKFCFVEETWKESGCTTENDSFNLLLKNMLKLLCYLFCCLLRNTTRFRKICCVDLI